MEKPLGSAAYKAEVERLGVIAFVPNGVSMWPMLKNHGQSVVVEKKTSRLKKYDVAFYARESGACVLHRVMEVTDDGYVMCGDSQFTLEKVKEEQVFGVMTGFYQKDEFVPADAEKYLKKVEKFYKRKLLRKIRIKSFMLVWRVKSKLKRIFKKDKKNV